MSSSYNIQVTIDEKGRILLPAAIRRTLGLEKGEKLRLEMAISENIVVMRRSGIYEKYI
ncbi:MAG: AbrB/MazE/SpoVT family DNA-binding domain-containing protein [Candidatus Aenigmarchaeota archaeon]|nr:AbrB/MazE/SpoVT family DNA-binding domain-containing protein [Candidatus Aenigmarchaeota archaeon]